MVLKQLGLEGGKEKPRKFPTSKLFLEMQVVRNTRTLTFLWDSAFTLHARLVSDVVTILVILGSDLEN